MSDAEWAEHQEALGVVQRPDASVRMRARTKGARLSTGHGRVLSESEATDELIAADARAAQSNADRERAEQNKIRLERIETPIIEAIEELSLIHI